jgi:hypothetical protein
MPAFRSIVVPISSALSGQVILGLIVLRNRGTTIIRNVEITLPTSQRHITTNLSFQQKGCENLNSRNSEVRYSVHWKSPQTLSWSSCPEIKKNMQLSYLHKVGIRINSSAFNVKCGNIGRKDAINSFWSKSIKNNNIEEIHTLRHQRNRKTWFSNHG